MIKPALFSLILFFIGVSLISCSNRILSTSSDFDDLAIESMMAQHPCIIYKTKADYSKQVPVTLSEYKTNITSYPDISDIRKQGEKVYPTALSNGFLLDNRGIGPNVAFLAITYDEFIKGTETPCSDELFHQILDADPLLVMYQCRTRHQYTEMVAELNQLIETDIFSNCKKLK